MPDEEIKNFNWRNYIEFDESVPDDKRQEMEQVLDLMFKDANGNGKIDNKAARQLAERLHNNADERPGKITITNYENGSSELTAGSSCFNPYDNSLNISYEQLVYIGYVDVDNGNIIPFSLNRAMFHELVHASDREVEFEADYNSEEEAMNLTNAYMKTEFGEPERDYYLLCYEYSFSERPDNLIVYSDGEKLSDKEVEIKKVDLEYLKDINEGLKYLVMKDARGSKYTVEEIHEFIEGFKGASEEEKEEFLEDLEDEIGEGGELIIQWIEDNGGVDKVVENGKLEKLLTNIFITSDKISYPIYIEEIQKFNLDVGKGIIKEDAKERKREERKAKKSGGGDKPGGESLESGGIDIGALEGLEVRESSIAEATTNSPSYSTVNKEKSSEIELT